MTEYKVKPGDTLCSIASEMLGDASLVHRIVECNEFDDPGNFAAGELEVGRVLRIPVTQFELQRPVASTPLVSVDQLRQIAPAAPTSEIARFIQPLNEAMEQYEIASWLRCAHFLAQVAHESSELRSVRENLSYSASGLQKTFPGHFRDAERAREYAGKPDRIANHLYADRMGNGNEASGDGWKYRGRGLIQLMGRDGYAAYTRYSGRDFVADPTAVADDPRVAADVAGWLWMSQELNVHADGDDLRAITRLIDGGDRTVPEREKILKRAKSALA